MHQILMWIIANTVQPAYKLDNHGDTYRHGRE